METVSRITAMLYAQSTLILRLIGGCFLLTVLGVVFDLIVFFGHVSFPWWVLAPWAVGNILISFFLLLHAPLYGVIVTQLGKGQEVADAMFIMLALLLLVLVPVADIYGDLLGGLSMFLFWSMLPISFADVWFLHAMQKETPLLEEKTEVQTGQACCSICKKVSQYEVCMECERKHRREIQRVRSQNWRAKKAGEPATLTLAEWLAILDTFQNHCSYCQTRPYEVMEHYIPIGMGKKDGGTTAKNCVPACRVCNSGKSNRHPEK